MDKNIDVYWQKFNEKRDKEEIQGEHRNWFVKVLTNRPFFVIHAFLYLCVNGFLIMIWLLSLRFTGLTYFWPFHTMFGWGFGLGFHMVSYIMYNDKSEYLTYVRQQSNYIMTFVYHAFFYISINLYLFLLNLIDLTFIWFTWTLGMWGIVFIYHAIGFFTWNKIFDNQWKKLRPKYQEYPKNKLKSKIKYKIGHFWLVLVHLTYFIVTFIIVNIFVFVGTGLGQVERLLIAEIFLNWGIYLALHAFGYILFYHIEFIKSVFKGLILHVSIYAIFNRQQIYENSESKLYMNWLIYLMALWAIVIIVHLIICIKWEKLIDKEQVRVKTKYDGTERKKIDLFWSGFSREAMSRKEINREEISQELTLFLEDDVRSIAKGIIIWKWSFITHVFIYIVSLIIIGINLAALGINLVLLIHPAMGWLIGVAAHGAIFYIIQKPIKGFFSYTAFLHLTVYIVTSIYLVILNVLFALGTLWSLIAILGWGIGIGIHLILMFITIESREIKKEETPSVSKGVLFWKWSFIIHFFIYITCLVIIGISLAVGGGNLLLLIHPAMGWLIGVAAHGAIYFSVQKPIKGFLNYTAFLHLIIYIVTCIYLVILNAIFAPEFPWSAIAIGGWGIGMGFHLLLAHLIKKED